MKILDNENIIDVDVDDTLIMHDLSLPGEKVTMNFYGEVRDFVIHDEHVKLLKNYKARGFTIFVWSGNGYKHAESAIKALGLEDYVDYIRTKPYRVIDDSDPNNWAPRIYIPYNK